MARRTWPTTVTLLLATLGSVGCPYDERRLTEITVSLGGGAGTGTSEGGEAGDGEGGQAALGMGGAEAGRGGDPGGPPGGGTAGTGTGGSTGGSSAGTAGSAGTGPCREDVNHNGVFDCEENLIENGTFDEDTSGWQAEPSSTLAWQTDNAPGTGTGSLAVTNTFMADSSSLGLTGSTYCVPLETGTKYVVYAQSYIENGESTASAGLSIWLYGEPDCTGAFAPLAHKSSSSFGQWATLIHEFEGPSGIGSALVRLVVSKRYEDPAGTALFDNVLVKSLD